MVELWWQTYDDNAFADSVLDLSFNRIKKIEGLDSLTKLELLNLTDNKISAIENMDSLQKLTNFGIANNLIPQLENVQINKYICSF